MRMKLIICLLAMSLGTGSTLLAQDHRLSKDVRRNVKHGNKLMHRGEHDKATAEYMKAYRADSSSAIVTYNLATSLFPDEWKTLRNGMRDTLATYYKAAGEAEDNRVRSSMSYYNMGVAYQTGGDFKNAIEAYKQALRCNPTDDEARYNLVLCQKQLKDDPQQQNESGDGQNQQQQQEQQEQQEQQQPPQEQQQQPQEQQQDQNWIDQMLNAAEQREKQTRRRLDEQQGQQNQRRHRNEKNW